MMGPIPHTHMGSRYHVPVQSAKRGPHKQSSVRKSNPRGVAGAVQQSNWLRNPLIRSIKGWE